MVVTLTGGCACGAVLYECNLETPLFADHCYCRDCQRASGTAMSSLLFVAKNAFQLVKGEVRYFEVVGGSGGNERSDQNCKKSFHKSVSVLVNG